MGWKVGDKVITQGVKTEIVGLPNMPEYDQVGYIDASEGCTTTLGWHHLSDLKKHE